MRSIKFTEVDFSKFAEARERMGYTLRDVACLTGVDFGIIGRMEVGRSKPMGEHVIKLMAFYGLSPHDVLVNRPPYIKG